MLKKRFAKYPSIFGTLDFDGLVDVARFHGMQIIGAFRGGLCVVCSFALYGTVEQMRAVEAEWVSNGHEMHTKRTKRGRSLIWQAPVGLPRELWADPVLLPEQTRTRTETLFFREFEENGGPLRYRGRLYTC